MITTGMTLADVETFDYEAHIDNIIELSEKIKLGEVTILTGSNSTGKSMVRKIFGSNFDNIKVASTSMQARTSSNPEWGALGGMMQDLDWIATSLNTLNLVNGLLGNENRFIAIDEPEIGMGRESVLGLANKLNQEIAKRREAGNFYGFLIITHNELLVQHLTHDNFINLDGLTEQEWLDREVVAVDLDVLKEFGNKLHRAIQNRINENKNTKK